VGVIGLPAGGTVAIPGSAVVLSVVLSVALILIPYFIVFINYTGVIPECQLFKSQNHRTSNENGDL
jgi:hypothetical protein